MVAPYGGIGPTGGPAERSDGSLPVFITSVAPNIAVGAWTPLQQVGLLSIIDYSIAASVNPNTDGSAILTATDPINGATMSRFSATFEATYKTAIINGKNIARYDGGVRGQRTVASAITFGAFERITVIKANTPAAATFVGAFSGGTSGFMTVGNTPSIRHVGAGGTSDKNLTNNWLDNTAHILNWYSDGTHAGHGFAIDNVAQVLTNGASTADPGTGVGANQITLGCSAGIASAITGDYGYDAWVDHKLTAAERLNWYTYLKAAWGTP